ncbi:LysE/ArgO family amino acid transporter [Oricola indica]|jgi:putative LysE/RhtB family amino acid efflux pump|uniref:LysE/ArgO family amino acid transporter n=1 Tax=Oricola indica TaxID=2872591 RepID=UPI001CC129AC|nr:LysE family transporter [Oricola indica]
MLEVVSVFAGGLAIGFAVAAPVGPIGLLCIRQTLVRGPLVGIATGLGAATADMVYGFVAVFGVGLITAALVESADILKIAGGAMLVYLGLSALRQFMRSRRQEPGAARRLTVSGGSAVAGFGTTFLLTLANPMTIIAFTAIVASLSDTERAAGIGHGLTVVAGVFSGSVAWWLFLVGTVSIIHKALPPALLRWIDLASGLVVLGFGLAAILSGTGVL